MDENVQTKFLQAVEIVQNEANFDDGNGNSLSNDEKLRFYALYKQATVGPCNTGKPAFWDVVSRVKWDAWSSLNDMTQEEAMEEYVEELISYLKRFNTNRPRAKQLIESLENQNQQSPISPVSSDTSSMTTAQTDIAGDTVGDLPTINKPSSASKLTKSPSKGLATIAGNRPGVFNRTPSQLHQLPLNSTASIEDRIGHLEVVLMKLENRMTCLESNSKVERFRLTRYVFIAICIFVLNVLKRRYPALANLFPFKYLF